MALVVKDRVKETTTTTGTGTYTVAGAVAGFQSFADALTDADTTWYGCENGVDWEVGLGTWDETAGTIARTQIYASSNSDSAVNWSAGDKNIFITLPASRKSTVTVYPTIDDLPLTGNVLAGDQAYVSGNNRLYLHNGSGWYNIALVNTTPTVSGNNASYVLAQDGTATVVTMSGTDAEGLPITWSATTSGDTSAATVTNVDNVFTITPSTNTADAGTLTVAFKASDGVNIGSSNSDFVLAFVSAYWPNVEYLTASSSTDALDNSTFIDRSSNARTVTAATGTPPQQAFHPYLDNWSVKFEQDDYVTAADDVNFDVSGAYTAEAWIYVDTFPSGNVGAAGQGFVMSRWDANSNQRSWGIFLGNNGGISLYHSATGDATYTTANASAGTITGSTWHHVAATWDGTTMRLFVDGTVVASTADASGPNSTPNAGVTLNSINVSLTGTGIKQYISNARYLPNEALYTGNFTSPITPLTAVTNTELLTCQSNRFIDNSSNAHGITVNGTPEVSAYNPFGQDSEYAVGENKGSVFFDNTGKIDVASCTDIGLGDFTFQAWIYPRSVSGTKMIISNRGDGGSIFLGTNGTDLYPYVGGSYQTSGAGLRAYEWAHVAFCRTSGNLETYVNGVRYRIDAKNSDLFGTTGYQIGSGDVGQWDGYIADLQVATTAKYTGTSYTIPTSPVGTTDADLYLPMDNAGIFDKTSVSTIELAGNAETDTAVTKFASSSLKFASANDYIVSDQTINTSSEDLTIEGWFYFDFVNSNVYIGGHNVTYVNNNNMFQLGLASAKPSWWIGGSASFAPSALSVDTWYHLAFVKQGNNYEIFVDGTSVRTFTKTNSINSYGWRLGNTFDGASQGFTGNIENFQILSNVAKYTANFTPPTATQGRTNQVVS